MTSPLSLPRKHSATKQLTIRTSVFALPILLVLALLAFSPNFQSVQHFRSTPLGSDFLQEWTGGFIWLSQQSSDLYSRQHYQTIQHDPSIVGFSWPASKYYPMVYPPFYYMLLSPLSLLPYKAAMVLWLFVIATASGASIYMWIKYLPSAEQHWGKCALAAIAFYPMVQSFNMAHKSALLLCILTGTYLLLYRRRPFAAGATFGLIAFKPHLAIVIGIAMLFKRQWYFVGGCAASVGTLILLSLTAGTDLCADYFQQCLSMQNYSGTAGYQLHESHSLTSAMQLTIDKSSSPYIYDCVTGLAVFSVVMIVFAILKGPIVLNSTKFALQFSTLVLATVLLSPHFYTYDLTILLLPIGLIVFAIIPKLTEASKVKRLRNTLIGCCIAFYVASGVSAKLATVIGFQLTILLMMVMLISILLLIQRSKLEMETNLSQVES